MATLTKEIKMFGVIILFCLYLILYLFFRNSARHAINDIRTNFRFFPKHYAHPPRWIRKHFNLRNEEIPKFLLFRLYVSLSFVLLEPIVIIVSILSLLNTYTITLLMVLPMPFVLFDTITFVILYHIYRK